MFEHITTWIMNAVQSYGAWGVFIGVIIESVIVPIPSPLIIMGAGMILIEPGISYPQMLIQMSRIVVLPGAVASTLGAFIGYGIGYWGSKQAVDKLEKFLGFSWSDIEMFQKRFEKKNLGLVIFLLRALPVVPLSLISAAVGALRWPVKAFTLWTFLGSIPRCLILGYLGWLTRDAYVGLAKNFNLIETLSSGIIVLGTGLIVLWLRARFKKV